MSIVFNGRAYAKVKEDILATQLSASGRTIKVKTFTFTEDEASSLYTRLKAAAAQRVGIEYDPVELSLGDETAQIVAQIKEASKDSSVNGVMVQKPSASVFRQYMGGDDFTDWWQALAAAIDPAKDVDCLNPANLARIQTGELTVLPATVRAVISILDVAREELHISPSAWKHLAVAIIGRSDIVGKPLGWILNEKHERVELFGRDNLPKSLLDFGIIIAASGKAGLIKANMIKDGAIVIDVGSPKGDVDFNDLVSKTAFITPVPGGVGPMTVISLMQNIIEIGE